MPATSQYEALHEKWREFSEIEKTELDKIYELSIDLFKKNRSLFTHIKHLSLNHGDPTRTNVFYDGGKIRLIDWEFVHYNVPEADLVFFVWSYNLDEKQKELFLRSYGFSNSKNAKKRFDLRMLAHIWGMISWRLERLSLAKEGKLARTEYCASRKTVYKENAEDIKKIKRVLEGLK